MGFMDAMKGANLNFGTVDSMDFPACYITQKGDHFMITGIKITYEFYKRDIAIFDVLASGGSWIKYRIKFKDGKLGIITSKVLTQDQKGTISMAPIERFFAEFLFNDNSCVCNSKINNEVNQDVSNKIVDDNLTIEKNELDEPIKLNQEQAASPGEMKKKADTIEPKQSNIEKYTDIDMSDYNEIEKRIKMNLLIMLKMKSQDSYMHNSDQIKPLKKEISKDFKSILKYQDYKKDEIEELEKKIKSTFKLC